MEGNMKVSDEIIKKFFLKRGSDTSDENVKKEMLAIGKNIESIYETYNDCIKQTKVLKEMIDEVRGKSEFPSENMVSLYNELSMFHDIARYNLIKLIFTKDKLKEELTKMDDFLYENDGVYAIPFFPGGSCVVLLDNPNFHNYDIGVPYITEGCCGQRAYIAYIYDSFRHVVYLGNVLPRRADVIRAATMNELLSTIININYHIFIKSITKFTHITKSMSFDKFREIITKIIMEDKYE
jgi:hypothetical protein